MQSHSYTFLIEPSTIPLESEEKDSRINIPQQSRGAGHQQNPVTVNHKQYNQQERLK